MSAHGFQLPALGIFSALGDESRSALAGMGSVRRLAAGEVLILEGEAQNFLYFVLSGQLSVTLHVGGKLVELGRLGFGDCFGEMGMLEQTTASASVTAADAACVWFIGNDGFERFLQQHHLAAGQMLLAIARVLTRRLREANELIRRHNLVPISLMFRGPGTPVDPETSREGLAARFRGGR